MLVRVEALEMTLARRATLGDTFMTPGVRPELAFRPRCYVAADLDSQWRTQRTGVPLAAFRTPVASGEQVAPAPGVSSFTARALPEVSL